MSENDSFLHEVSEEVRRDQFLAFLKRNAVWFVAAFVLIVGGAGYMEWQKARERASAQATGDTLWAGMNLDDPQARLEHMRAAGLPTDGAGQIAALQVAAAAAADGDAEAAVAALRDLAAAGGTDPALRDVARLKMTMLGAEVLPEPDRMDLLQTITAEGHALRPLALEQRALIHIGAGRTDEAVEDLAAIADDPAATSSVRNRADALLTALGQDAGEEPADG